MDGGRNWPRATVDPECYPFVLLLFRYISAVTNLDYTLWDALQPWRSLLQAYPPCIGIQNWGAKSQMLFFFLWNI